MPHADPVLRSSDTTNEVSGFRFKRAKPRVPVKGYDERLIKNDDTNDSSFEEARAAAWAAEREKENATVASRVMKACHHKRAAAAGARGRPAPPPPLPFLQPARTGASAGSGYGGALLGLRSLRANAETRLFSRPAAAAGPRGAPVDEGAASGGMQQKVVASSAGGGGIGGSGRGGGGLDAVLDSLDLQLAQVERRAAEARRADLSRPAPVAAQAPPVAGAAATHPGAPPVFPHAATAAAAATAAGAAPSESAGACCPPAGHAEQVHTQRIALQPPSGAALASAARLSGAPTGNCPTMQRIGNAVGGCNSVPKLPMQATAAAAAAGSGAVAASRCAHVEQQQQQQQQCEGEEAGRGCSDGSDNSRAPPLFDAFDTSLQQLLLDTLSPPFTEWDDVIHCSREEEAALIDAVKRGGALARKHGRTAAAGGSSSAAAAVVPHSAGGVRYSMGGCIGEGSYAIIHEVICYEQEGCAATTSTAAAAATTTSGGSARVALKLQSPPCAWEFYVLRALAGRCHPGLRCLFADARRLLLHPCSSLLQVELGMHGTLQELINAHLSRGQPMPEPLALWYAAELLRMARELHRCGIVHTDIKPDNLLLRYDAAAATDPEWDPLQPGAWRRYGLTLIDFGRAIDLRLLPPGAALVGDSHTEMYRCPEMQRGAPWRHQADAFCIAGVLHCMLFGRHMEVAEVAAESSSAAAAAAAARRPAAAGAGADGGSGDGSGSGGGTRRSRFAIRAKLRRYWAEPLWRRLFDELLNPAPAAAHLAGSGGGGSGGSSSSSGDDDDGVGVDVGAPPDWAGLLEAVEAHLRSSPGLLRELAAALRSQAGWLPTLQHK